MATIKIKTEQKEIEFPDLNFVIKRGEIVELDAKDEGTATICANPDIIIITNEKTKAAAKEAEDDNQ